MTPHLVFTSNGLLGDSGYTSPKVEMVLYERLLHTRRIAGRVSGFYGWLRVFL